MANLLRRTACTAANLQKCRSRTAQCVCRSLFASHILCRASLTHPVFASRIFVRHSSLYQNQQRPLILARVTASSNVLCAAAVASQHACGGVGLHARLICDDAPPQPASPPTASADQSALLVSATCPVPAPAAVATAAASAIQTGWQRRGGAAGAAGTRSARCAAASRGCWPPHPYLSTLPATAAAAAAA